MRFASHNYWGGRITRCSRGILALAGILGWVVVAIPAVYLTKDQALEKAFPGAEIKRQTLYLTAGQLERAKQEAGEDIESTIVYAYEAWKDDRRMGTAYFDVHKVRTLPETLLIVVSPSGTVNAVNVLAFKEPQEYLPGKRWFAQFDNRGLDDELRLNREIDGITGATLSARAATAAVRRILAVHRVLQETPSP